MDYKLKEGANGEVSFITSAGSDYVKATMPIGQAAAIVSANGFEESDTFGGFPILADGKYFEGKIIEAKPEKKTTSKKK